MHLTDWMDSRTGYRKLMRGALDEPIPGGARWRYVWGSALVFVLVLQVVTGVLLMTAYSPSTTTAWSSVWYIQTRMTLGWLIRGLHHFGSQAMIVLMIVHLFQVVLAKAYRAPREINWWLGLGLAGSVLGLALTGYLLPWDQKGYWATKVATNIMALTPVIGDSLQRILIGGEGYGHATVTRFFTLHVMVLPGLVALFLVAHLALFRRHGVTSNAKDADTRAGALWPEQLFRDNVAAAVLLVILFAIVWYAHDVSQSNLLDAPADATSSDYPARPEWYFLFLFQLLKYFEGPVAEVIGAIVLPVVVVVAFGAVPLFDKVLPDRLAHGMVVGLTSLCLATAGWLTFAAVRDDREPLAEVVSAIRAKQQRGETLGESDRRDLRAHLFHRQRLAAERLAGRAFELAKQRGIPPEGPLALLANDPATRGPILFAAHCATCHRFGGQDGLGSVPAEPATSSDLRGYATRPWIRGLLQDPLGDGYFGRMVNPDGDPAHTRMSVWVSEQMEENRGVEDQRRLRANFDAVACYLEDESRRPGRLAHVSAEANDAGKDVPAPNEAELEIVRGRRFFMSVCNECHSYRGERSGRFRAPEMFGYGSVAWIEEMLADPSAETRYRSRGREPARMPSFEQILSPRDRRLVAQWLHGQSSTAPSR